MGFVLIGISAFTELGINGAVLQMISHGLIAAVLFFLTGITYERTHTLALDKLGGLAKQMPKAFTLFTAGSLASLALPGMSGFVGELTVFLGLTTSDAYAPTFKAGIALLAAVGIILTPIYLLSMLRQVFYGAQDPGLVLEDTWGICARGKWRWPSVCCCRFSALASTHAWLPKPTMSQRWR
jgi:NAD(P)H-quinone oxidoreductase subunit 4